MEELYKFLGHRKGDSEITAKSGQKFLLCKNVQGFFEIVVWVIAKTLLLIVYYLKIESNKGKTAFVNIPQYSSTNEFCDQQSLL